MLYYQRAVAEFCGIAPDDVDSMPVSELAYLTAVFEAIHHG
jgi:hypothetical protein